MHLEQFKRSVDGKPRLGVEIFGKALLVVPKTLLENSGMDVQEQKGFRSTKVNVIQKSVLTQVTKRKGS